MRKFRISALFVLSTILGLVAFVQSSFACGFGLYDPEMPEELQ
ncbi:cyclic lactone autoinducer peptide [Cohnella terricola]|uniref:Cyclic lactone autoinducer peptide n=1 Tax=Cohnella terricola TaxID=1289167 RepID=A0A559JN54_9BACL|nr:cyclic lactone autoinducer peptide [Cohnella terricola]TVY01300.1 cyclic lactone autoinducer peptide [Cohnella terricola]